ncbi:MAG: glycine cleavage system protein GcvH [Planctomycetes bacterium]|nr:glycine cleavage system protein GcvH [Planctomycetota bacterium]
MDLAKLRYAKSHEWALLEGGVCTVGITQFAVEQLTDVTNLDLPKVGKKLEGGKPFGEIESVKAVFDLYAPVSGDVVEVNPAVAADPGVINQDPYGIGWMLKIKVAPGATLAHLMDLAQYEKQIAEDGGH